MRATIALAICVLVLSASPGRADPLADVVARLDALEKRNDELAKENASLRDRVAKLEGSANAAPAEVSSATVGRNATPVVTVTTSAVIPTSAHYPNSATAPSLVPERAFSWSGAYVGVHGGGGWSDVAFSEIPTVPFVVETFRDDLKSSGGLGGIQLGANKQFGNWVVGGELSVSGAGLSGKNHACLDDPFLGIDAQCETRINWLVTGLARLGYAHDRWLVSGSAGWTVAGAEHEFALDAGVPVSTGYSETLDGFTYGVGFNYALTRTVTLGVEYLHADLQAEGSGFLSSLIGFGKGARDVDLDIARAQLNVKLGE